MSRPFAALERLFERIFERPAARLFGTRLEPVQLQRRLEREMDTMRRFSANRTYVPNDYWVLLHPDDLAHFSSFRATLESDLATALHERARNRRYTLLERPRVHLETSPGVALGEVRVAAQVVDPVLAGRDRDRRTSSGAYPREERRIGPPPGASPGFRPLEGDPPRHEVEPGERPGPRVAETAMFSVPRPRVARALLEVIMPDGSAQRLALGDGSMRIGRSSDNDLVLVDERASRYHGQLAARQGALVYTDLGSTNGSYLNGTPVHEIALGPGDVLQIGDSYLRVHVEA